MATWARSGSSPSGLAVALTITLDIVVPTFSAVEDRRRQREAQHDDGERDEDAAGDEEHQRTSLRLWLN